MSRYLRECLMYATALKGHRFVIKLGEYVSSQAEEMGVLANIRLLHALGIEVVITHADQSLPVNRWRNLFPVLHPTYDTDVEVIEHCLREKKIPVVCCSSDSTHESDAIVVKIALSVRAQKIIFLTQQDGVFDAQRNLVRQCTYENVETLLQYTTGGMKQKILHAVDALAHGIERVHIIGGLREDTLLEEVFSSSGVGTMLYKAGYQEVLRARPDNAQSMKEIIAGVRIKEPIGYSEIVSRIRNFWILMTDKHHPQGCMLLTYTGNIAEVAYLCTIPREDPQGERVLFSHAYAEAQRSKMSYIVLRESRNNIWLPLKPWIFKAGFERRNSREIGLRRHPSEVLALSL